MRRSERETDRAEAVEILRGCPYITVAFSGDAYPYAVPMHFGMEEGEGLTLWLHGAGEGKRRALLAKNSRVAFSGVRTFQNVPPSGGIPCSATARYESVFGEGEMHIVTGEEAERGLRLLLRRCGMPCDGAFSPAALNKTCVFRLSVASLTGKRHA